MKLYLLEKTFISSYLDDIAKLKEQAASSRELKFDPKRYEVNNGEALIPVLGTLQRSPDFYSYVFGSSTYDEIATMTIEADKDPEVERIAYLINSPGGTVDGVDMVGQVIKATKKPTISYVDSMATSAAYWLASQTDEIVATSPTAEFGSIGVVVAGLDVTGIWVKMGAKLILITSTDAPEKKKSYQLDTKGGENALIKRLDALHEVFAERVADGRNTTVEGVNKNFGRGAVVSARKALTMGMIDNILGDESGKESKASSDIKERTAKMDRKELKENYPALLGEIEVEAYDAGKAAGIEKERKRVADLNCWRDKGDACTEIVDEAIKSGAEYMEVASKLHASVSQAHVEGDPPPIAGDPNVKVAGDKKEELSEEEIIGIGKEIAQGIGGTNG